MLSGGGKGVELIMEAVLAALGAGTNDVLAAFLGSIVAAFLLPNQTQRTVISTVVVGTIAGIYFGPNLPPLIGLKPSNMITAMIGMAGTPLCVAAVKWITGKFSGLGDKNVPVDVRRDS
jgi:hypothetical protein